MSKKIIVVDDEPSMLAVIEAMLSSEEYEVHSFDDAVKAIEFYRTHGADLIISDIRMEKMDGISFLKGIREISAETMVILITAFANVQDALHAMKMGAYDYLQKPFKMEKLRALVKRALTVQEILIGSPALEKTQETTEIFCGIVSQNKVMKELFSMIKKAAPSKTTILLQGESGTGKELFARAIHANSGRQEEPFVAINCGALPEPLLESELFGHVKGAFTGAVEEKVGLFKAAGNGTIFLDEIASLTLNLQAKLLRVLQEKEIRPVGSVKTEKVGSRVIAATNTSIEEMVTGKNFREDLYYRLNIIPIEIPPLRERPDDLMPLIRYFFRKYSPDKLFRISPMALNTLLEYRWPGNIRELESTIERITTLCSNELITPEDLPAFLRKSPRLIKTEAGKTGPFFQMDYSFKEIIPLKRFIALAEGQYIHFVLHKTEEDDTLAAKYLGIDINSLKKKLERLEKLKN
ncbi:MAG: sigma-54-dependent Fis family transcriptional regulator [Candidatus Aureabacteria bacterium]|nr:sigma-54-dependent Fis family transcriptional regulator [Candidatus Auribacterota bacterium]